MCTTPSSDNNNTNEKPNKDCPENVIPKMKDNGQKDQLEYNNIGSEVEDDKEEVKISGCRRRIQNRPAKKNSKSKSFNDQHKYEI